MILNLAKRLKESEELVRNGDFQKKFSLKGTDVAGKTLGIIGLGKIGKEVARKAALGLDMRVISYVPHPEGKEIPEYVEIVSWEELCKRQITSVCMCREEKRTRELFQKKSLP